MDALALTTCDWSAYVGCGLDKVPRTHELYDSNSALYESYVGSINPDTHITENRLIVIEFILGFLLLGLEYIGLLASFFPPVGLMVYGGANHIRKEESFWHP